MTLREVFRFEVEYRLRQPSTWVYALVLFGLPFLTMHAINGSRQYLNAPVMVMNASAILGTLGMLVTAGIFGDAAARDVQSRMHALFFTSPLREAHYLAGRFLGGLAVNAVLLLGVPLGLLLASVMPYMAAGKFGPVQPAAYVQAYLLLLLPNLVLIGAFMFAVAALTRQSLTTYLGGIALFVLGTIAGKITGPSNATLSALVDPLGTRAVALTTQYWTPVERDARLVGWPHLLLWNRALWLAVAAGVLALLVARFRFGHQGDATRRRWWRRRALVDTAPARVGPIGGHAPDAARSFSTAGRVRQTLAVAARAWREIAATRAFLVVLAGALLFVFTFGWDVGSEVYGTSTWPVTHLIAGTVLSAALAPVMALLIAIFAGELVWRERDVGMGDIAAVAPVPNGVALLGRFLALVGMLVALQAVLMGAGVLLQALRGYHRYELGVYLELLFGIKLVDYVLLAALAMAVHVIVNQKYVGHLIVVLYFASTLAAGLIGLRHHLLIYGSDPGWVWSDLNGLAPFVAGLVWFKLYWAAWALLLAVAASLFWVRGREIGWRARLALARQRLGGPAVRAAALALALIVSLGGFVFYNTNVLNDYGDPDEIAAHRAEYERRYKRFEDAPEPSLVAARMRVELYPAQRAAELRGTFQLVNRTTRPIDSLHVLPSPDVETRALRFDRATRLVVDDSARRYRIYALARPLAPGDSLAMSFEVASHPRGFRNAGAPTAVTPNGAYVDRTWLPALGYLRGRELADERERREHGLPPRTPPPTAGDVETRATGPGARGVELVDAETIVGTDARQIAVTSGTLVREWRERGRRYFQYRTEAPTRYGGAVLSAEYAVREARWNGIPLRVYYHPTHDVNVDRMIRSMQASLAYYSEHFGPYQFRELSIVEFPRYASFARAHPHMIAFSEGSAFLTRVDSGDVDRPFFVVAHETAHQWWGGQVIPAGAAGASFVSETLAQYSSMMVLETAYGADMARRFYDYNMAQYLTGRSVYTNREAPLLDVVNQSYVYYFKGAVAMYTLRERLGADAMNGALRRFREKFAGPDAPPPTSRALYAELQAVTPDSLRPLLSDLFEHITLWSVRTDSARAEPTGGGAYRVTLFVDASKARADSIGNQTPVAMNDLVEIGAFGASAGGGSLGETLYLAQHRIHTGKQTIVLTVPRRPARAGIDPFRKLIERERDDNVADVPGQAGAR
ncbi:Peptidase M1 membrane alanine aminopeptidase (plasmid) [Gemmatirosa kalamazoonensis]|uniref:Peptidase M1 membrane alanine aminopeptidase n=1 Tax=Gemmatirosa kalamazoonensis TaxID=861299 RepID=W0RSR9_9BACT|nr:M1 family aminopeptidase [Gemmatirosa kalamazoonensis]AHG92628.1 Peptidase M1 membrane alanine aminopeptidase [Gemmatirosa kalamazoonensis]